MTSQRTHPSADAVSRFSASRWQRSPRDSKPRLQREPCLPSTRYSPYIHYPATCAFFVFFLLGFCPKPATKYGGRQPPCDLKGMERKEKKKVLNTFLTYRISQGRPQRDFSNLISLPPGREVPSFSSLSLESGHHRSHQLAPGPVCIRLEIQGAGAKWASWDEGVSRRFATGQRCQYSSDWTTV